MVECVGMTKCCTGSWFVFGLLVYASIERGEVVEYVDYVGIGL